MPSAQAFIHNTQRYCLIALIGLTAGCYKVPLTEIKSTHQYTAQELMDQWRSHAARNPLPLVHNDDYYAPYSPPIRSKNNQNTAQQDPAYYYDPRVDNPQPYTSEQQGILHGVVTHDLLYAY